MKRIVFLAVVALVAFAGVAYAAGSITGKSIKDGTLTGKDIKNKSLTPTDFRGSVRGARGPSGPVGPHLLPPPPSSAASSVLRGPIAWRSRHPRQGTPNSSTP